MRARLHGSRRQRAQSSLGGLCSELALQSQRCGEVNCKMSPPFFWAARVFNVTRPLYAHGRRKKVSGL